MTVAARPTAGTLQQRVASIVAGVLRVPAEWISPQATFASLGLDSLGAVELTAAIEDELAVRLPLTAAHDFPTVESLARFIECGQTARDSLDPRARMLADAVFPCDIHPRTGEATSALESHDILLTGATGFLGAYLLRALLDDTRADVHCLVRPSRGDPVPKDRVLRNLAEYDLARPSDANRLRVIEGDLAQPLLGLSHDSFHALAERIGAIYHCGATVNWVYGYEELRETNILGTVELLRLACTGVAKPFHFVSSVSACHSTSAPAVVDETCDTLTNLDGLHFGYAQSKCVAEALVRQAAQRGLPASIIRPSLVTGDSRSGRSNLDDLTSRFVAGCIRMQSAPDLDWRMDCVPVDDAARAIVRLTSAQDRGLEIAHLTADRPRHWRESVLWMRLAGYQIQLVSYRQWVEQLRATIDRDHPLFPLRSFFLTAVPSEGGLTLPELFEESRRSRVAADRTRDAMSRCGAPVTDVDLEMLNRYFDDYVARGLIPEAGARIRIRDARPAPPIDRAVLQAGLSRNLGRSIQIERAVFTPVSSEESIIAELTGWRSGASAGLMRGHLSYVSDDGAAGEARVFVKAKAADEQSIEVAEALGGLISPSLGATISAFRDRLGLTRSHLRELAIYADDDPRIAAHRPRTIAVERNDADKRWAVAMEAIDDALLINALSPAAWTDDAIDAALRGLAQIHARWYGADEMLKESEWLSPISDATSRTRMTPLWLALADHSASHAAWRDQRLRSLHASLVRDTASWSRVLDESPRTLIHNDFNPRNIAIVRRRGEPTLCALDWELATIGAPQRDLAEFLCFVLPANAARETAQRWIERSRVLLSAATNDAIDPEAWQRGFSAALCDLLVDRLSMLAMIDRVRPQSFLPRVVRSWTNLFAITRDSH